MAARVRLYNYGSTGGWSSFSPVTNSVYLPAGTVKVASPGDGEWIAVQLAGSLVIAPSSNGGGGGGGGGTVSISTQWMTSFNQLNIVGSSGNDSHLPRDAVRATPSTRDVTNGNDEFVQRSVWDHRGRCLRAGTDSITIDSSVRVDTAVYGGSGNSTDQETSLQGLATQWSRSAAELIPCRATGLTTRFGVNAGSDVVNAS